MLDKITNKNCKTFFCYFPLFFGNVCLGAQYLYQKLSFKIMAFFTPSLLFCVLLVANEHDFIWQNTFNCLIKSACFSFMQI